ncbi:helix-turn-helix transcriptional regulator [Streptomyces macrosporus]|uniref:HTH cro/C1-type domain-containing protein n=1 Tax=Streptomyces macrosporus TaxID=44032 RepID=A0ABP5X1M4_9ACTN
MGVMVSAAQESYESYDDGELSSDLMRAIGKQPKVLRERAGMAQKELGDALGYSEDLISSVERGRRTPQRGLLEAADELLNAGGVLKAAIDESVLRRKLGGRKVRQGQLGRLVELGRLRNITLQVLPLDCEENPGVDGPFVLLTPKGKQQVTYLEVQGVGQLMADPEEVRILAARHGIIRGQAHTPRESLALMKELLGER